MTTILAPAPTELTPKQFLRRFSTEVTTADARAIDEAGALLAPGSEVFIAALPKDTPEVLAPIARKLRLQGLVPAPHLVARTYRDLAHFEETLKALNGEAGIDRALVLAGDKPSPLGALSSSLELIQSGLLQAYGVRNIALACYPEGHPRISNDVLEAALTAKLAAAAEAGLLVTLMSQFCFDAAPILTMAQRLRAQGVTAPLRVGLAAPASRVTLLKYAMICGVGPSLRALNARPQLAGIDARETPAAIIAALAHAQSETPSLRFAGAHFFTFAALASLTKWVRTL